MITRDLQALIENRLFKGKAIIVIGARQVGKSTLFQQIMANHSEKMLSLNCDDPQTRSMLQEANLSNLRLLIADNKILIIDEAQRIKDVWLVLKLICDNFPEVQLLVTGSSALGLQDKLNEPLTGRKFEYQLFPISTAELLNTYNLITVNQLLKSRLIFGSYPDVICNNGEAKEILNKILVSLAIQVGNEVSYNELAQTVGTDSKTVEKYIDLLEKSYVIFRLPALTGNLRNELKKGKKIYFYDNGIRNAIIQNFSPLALRSDIGALWENFFISERIKKNHYSLNYSKSYFWRTTAQQEIDYIEEQDGKFSAFEMKWNPKKGSTKLPDIFKTTYFVEQKTIISPENYLDYLV